MIAGIAKGKQRQCFASNAWLGNNLGLKPCYVRELIGELIRDGFLAASYGKRSRYLWVTGNLGLPTVTENQGALMALNTPPAGPGAAPLPPSDGPTTAPIRIINIKESKEISPAAPENFFLGNTNTTPHANEDTLLTTSTNQVDETLITIHSTEIQNVVSQTTSTNTISQVMAIPPRWNPETDFEWQYKQFLTVIKGCFVAMQHDRVIARSKSLIIDDKQLREFCLDHFQGRLVAINPDHQRLDFTEAVGDFQWVLFRSWFGMGQIGQVNQGSPKKYNVWLITKNTNDLTKFIQRYPKIRQQLRKQSEFDAAIDTITQPVRNQVLFNWWRHGWSHRWNPTGNILFAEIPDDILDDRGLEQARLEFESSVRYALERRQTHRSQSIPEFLHEGANQCNPLWSISFAWLMLHRQGLHQAAQQYEAGVMDGFRIRPEILQVYRERLPEVLRKIRANAG